MKFEKLNVNPKNKKTGDCVIRALSLGLNKDYWQVVDDLMQVYKKTGYIINEKQCFKKYLEKLGYEMQKMPRRENKTRYTLYAFIEELAKPDETYLVLVAHHITCVKGKTLYDLWDCSCKYVGNYWIIT